MAPIAVAALPFGIIFGVEAARQGLSVAEAVTMSLLVFAGGSQFLAMGLWADPIPVIGIALATFVVNLRHVLMAASLAGKMGRFGRVERWAAVFFLADETWALAERRALAQPLSRGFYWGAGLTLYALWPLGALIGGIAGGFIPDPARWGLDFAFPALFICLVIGFARGWRAAPVVGASALVALAVHALVPGTWYVLAGGLAGMAVAALLPPDPAPHNPDGLP